MFKTNHLKAGQAFKNSHKILFISHNRPDGDTLAASCALIDLADELGKKFTAFCADEPNQQFDFLPHVDKFKTKIDNFSSHDLIVVLDCGSIERTGLVSEIKNKKDKQTIIEFDHHLKVDDYTDISLKISSAASTTEVLYDFFKLNNFKINKNRATCILTGISTDTGNFIYPSTSEKTISIASKMISYGAKLPMILDKTWRNKNIKIMKLWGLAINHLKINKKYNFAYTVITHKEIEESGVSSEDLEGISGFLSNLKDVNALLFLTEIEPGFIKGSLRTARDNVNVSTLANKLGGGGHAKASGFRVNGKIEVDERGWKII